MKSKFFPGLLMWSFALVAVFVLATPALSQAQPVEYNVVAFSDFSGPYAAYMPFWAKARARTVAWWNDEVGSKLGVKLNFKEYDTRYNTAQTASMWPGILADRKPLLIMGLGGPDVAALRKRLKDDGVPMFMMSASYGFAWEANTWFFTPRATYGHEAAAAIEYFRKQKGKSGAMKVAIVSSEAAPAYVDMAKGLEKYAKDNATVEVVETIFTAVQPTDLSSSVRRVVRKGAEMIVIQTNTAMVVATKRALQAMGRDDIPILLNAHNGLGASGRALGDIKQLEGSYEAYGLVSPALGSGASKDFYKTLESKYGLDVKWNLISIQGAAQALYSLRVVENAIKQVGAANLTGRVVQEALFSQMIPSADTFGFLPDLKFSKESPFPTTGTAVSISTIKDGKYVQLVGSVPTPELQKW